MNKHKDLRDLFRKYLKRINSSVVVYYPNSSSTKSICIHFYEWSDVCRMPRCFYSIKSFTDFLKSSNIKLSPYEEESLRRLNCAYVSCYKGTSLLCIRNSYELLRRDLSNKESYFNGSNGCSLVPYENKSKSKIEYPKLLDDNGNVVYGDYYY